MLCYGIFQDEEAVTFMGQADRRKVVQLYRDLRIQVVRAEEVQSKLVALIKASDRFLTAPGSARARFAHAIWCGGVMGGGGLVLLTFGVLSMTKILDAGNVGTMLAIFGGMAAGTFVVFLLLLVLPSRVFRAHMAVVLWRVFWPFPQTLNDAARGDPREYTFHWSLRRPFRPRKQIDTARGGSSPSRFSKRGSSVATMSTFWRALASLLFARSRSSRQSRATSSRVAPAPESPAVSAAAPEQPPAAAELKLVSCCGDSGESRD
jgi:hypothetical protein